VTGRNVLVHAVGTDDVIVGGELEIVDDDLAEDEDNISVEMGLYEAKSERKIEIGALAKIIAAEAIDVLASLKLDKGYIPIPDFVPVELDPFILKIGNAVVDVKGQLIAGGSIHAAPEVRSTRRASSRSTSRRRAARWRPSCRSASASPSEARP